MKVPSVARRIPKAPSDWRGLLCLCGSVAPERKSHSSDSRREIVGLCFSFLRAAFGTLRVGGGAPTCSPAAAFTALAAENDFFLRRGMVEDSRGLQSHPVWGTRGCCAIINWMALDERDFYDEKEQKKPATLNCPSCKQSAEYELSWLVRTKKKQLPPRADERDRAKFAKARSYMVRKDDLVMCKNMRCRKRIEVSGVQSVAFLD